MANGDDPNVAPPPPPFPEQPPLFENPVFRQVNRELTIERNFEARMRARRERGFAPPVVLPPITPETPPIFRPPPPPGIPGIGVSTGAGRAAVLLGRLGGPLAGAVFAIDILWRIAQRKQEIEEEEKAAIEEFERQQRALRRPTRVIEIPGPPLDVPLPESIPQIKPVILPEIVTAPPVRVPLETAPAPLEIPAPTLPEIEVSPQIEIEAPTAPRVAPPIAAPEPVVLPPLATPGFGTPTKPVIPQVGPATEVFLGRIALPQADRLADLVARRIATRVPTRIGDLTPIRVPDVDFPTLAQPLPISQAQPPATAEKDCQIVKRRRRKRGKCREGFFRESRDSTQYVTWRTRECTTGIKLSEK